MSKKSRQAFSLVELSIVILILSILISGSIGVSKSVITSSKNKITKERMDEVYKSLSNFVATYKRLPCPALQNVAKGGSTSYGDETATPGTCTGFTVATSTNLIYGMIPIKALGLDSDMAEDGFGTKFSYVVDKRFTRANTSAADTADGFEATQAVPSPELSSDTVTIIKVQSPSGTDVMTNALFLIISHGANKFSGWNASGTAQNSASNPTVADEDSNSGSHTGTTTFNDTFVISSSNATFDDVVLFKNKTQLVKDAGLEFMICNGYEAKPASSGGTCTGYNWHSGLINADYNTYGCSNANSGNYCRRMCGKYGIWGSGATTGNSCSTF